jgi:hypothetical protein
VNLNQQVPIVGQGDPSAKPLIDMSPTEGRVRKDVANLAQGILQTHACTAESAFRAAEDFYRLKDHYMRTGEIGASEDA